jgi:hypothetical protein
MASLRRSIQRSTCDPVEAERYAHTSLYQWVDFYLDRSWPMFPLRSSMAVVRAHKHLNVGRPVSTIATGRPTHLVVIDIDPRHGGDRTPRKSVKANPNDGRYP